LEEGWETAKIADFTLIQDVIRTIRNLRAERKVGPAKRIPATIAAGGKTTLLKSQTEIITTLAGLDADQVSIVDELTSRPENCIALVVGPVEIYIPLAGMLDLEEERRRLQKDLAEIQVQIDRLEKLLNSDFNNKAPAQVVEKERVKLAGFKDTADKLRTQMNSTH
jgi:valyl-tRNA synthetase